MRGRGRLLPQHSGQLCPAPGRGGERGAETKRPWTALEEGTNHSCRDWSVRPGAGAGPGSQSTALTHGGTWEPVAGSAERCLPVTSIAVGDWGRLCGRAQGTLGQEAPRFPWPPSPAPRIPGPCMSSCSLKPSREF